MGYFYLDELEKDANAFTYDVQAKPPPADAATATVRRGAPDGDEIYNDATLVTAGKGKFKLDKAQLKASDSPVFIEFKFTKSGTDKVQHKAVVLADPQPSSVTVPKSAVLGQEVELKVAGWSAVTFEKPGEEKVVKEANGKRIGQDARDAVKWQVDGKDISETGEKVKLTIAEEHLGKDLAVEAYIGSPSGRAKGTVKVYKLASIDPADGGSTKKWYVNLPLTKDEPDAPNGRDVTIKATIEPAAAGVTVYFFLTDNTGSRTLSGDTLSDNVKAKLASASATTNKEGVASMKLTLSSYGGDKQRVYASLTKGAAESDSGVVKTCEFEVWRKLNYELDIMSGLSDGGATAAAKDKWKDLFLEAEQVGSDSSPTNKVITQAEVNAGAWQKGFRNFGHKDESPLPPGYLQLIYVQDISLGTKTETTSWDREALEEGQFYKDPIASQELEGYVFDPEKWFVSCKWKSGTKSGSLNKDEQVFLELGVKGTGDFAGKTVDRITIKGAGDDVMKPRKPLRITLTYKHMSVLAGYSKGDTAVVAVGISGRKKLGADDKKNHLLCCALHEAGHSLGLASTGTARKPSENLLKAKITYQQGGNHCHEGGDTCIMFDTIPSSTPVSAPAFCDYCKDALRARHLPKPGTLNPF